MITLGLTSGMLELATMVPYIATIGILTRSGLPFLEQAVTLGGYTAVMALPALLLIGIATYAGPRIDGVLKRIEGWITRNSDVVIGWALGIVGFLVAVNAASALFW